LPVLRKLSKSQWHAAMEKGNTTRRLPFLSYFVLSAAMVFAIVYFQ
jgi:hypothetical protein